MITTPCLLFTGVGRVELGETELPEPGADDVVVETILSGVSPGTELRCLGGEQDGLGRDYFPFIPGYSLVGTVVHASGRHAALEGKVVFSSGARRARERTAWGGHIGAAVVPGASVVPVPDTVPLEDAVLAKLAAIAHRGVVLARPQPGEDTIVVGLGPIGQMSARLFSQAGARVLAVDLATDRVQLAERAGIRAVALDGALEPAIRRHMPHGAPIVVDATGARALLRDTMSLLRDKPWDDTEVAAGRLVVQGSYPADISIPSTIAFAREMTMLWPRDSQRSDMEHVFTLLAAGRLSFAGLMGSPCEPADAQSIYDRLKDRSAGMLTAAFRWRTGRR